MSTIAVYCSAEDAIHPDMHTLAFMVGNALAARGHTTVYGGGKVGMMGALAKGVLANRKELIGIIPRFMVEREWANHDCTELVIVDSMAERKTLFHDRADAHLALPGGLGTLDELLDPWTTGSLALHDKPVVLLDHRQHWLHFLLYTCCLAGSGFVSLDSLDRLQVTDDLLPAIAACTGETVLPAWSRELRASFPQLQLYDR